MRKALFLVFGETMTRRSKAIRVPCLMALLGAGATAVWSLDEAASRSVTVVNHAPAAVTPDEAVSRSVTVVNHAVVPATVDEAISRSVTVVNRAIVVPDITESISRSVSVCNRAGAPDSDGDGVNDCEDKCPGFDDRIDRDGDGVPDACDNCVNLRNPGQEDCDHDGIGDVCEIAAGAPDCTGNGIPDSCEPDCNHNGRADSCDIAACADSDPACADCNLNGIPDACDIAGGFSRDLFPTDGVPDECVKWLGGADNWDNPARWEGNVVPNDNNGSFSPSIPTPGATVLLNIPVTIDTLLIGPQTVLKVTSEEPNDLAVIRSGGLSSAGQVLVAEDRAVTVSAGVFRLESGGVYGAEAGATGVSAVLSTAGVVMDSADANPFPAGAPQMLLSEDMAATVSGDFVIRANAAEAYMCPSSVANIAGGVTPPILKVIDRGRVSIAGDLTLEHAALLQYSSLVPMTLSGDFVNASVYPVCFDCLLAYWLLNGAQPQTFEAAGEDRLRSIDGFVNNFAIGTLELGSGTIATVVDIFDNQLDGLAQCDEVLYVDTLVIRKGAKIRTTDGCRLYYRTLVDLGGMIDGTLIRLALCDFNGDGFVNFADHAAFVTCMSGNPPAPPCLDAFDVDMSGSLDLRDFANLQNLFSAPVP